MQIRLARSVDIGLVDLTESHWDFVAGAMLRKQRSLQIRTGTGVRPHSDQDEKKERRLAEEVLDHAQSSRSRWMALTEFRDALSIGLESVHGLLYCATAFYRQSGHARALSRIH